jgi:VanZ family protein
MKCNEESKKKIIGWILLLSWIIFIFYMSSKSGNESSAQSNFVYKIISNMGINLDIRFEEFSIVIIRKSAHFLEYTILYLLSINLISKYRKSNKITYIYSLILVFLYACTDEFHQLFVQGRSGKFTDVYIDSLGGIFGFIIVYIKNIILKFIKKGLTVTS